MTRHGTTLADVPSGRTASAGAERSTGWSPAAASPLTGRVVAVVGAGIVGLTTALRLRGAGADVVIVSSGQRPPVSPEACAFWLPAWSADPTGRLLGGPVDRYLVERSWHTYRMLLSWHGRAAGMREVTNHEYLDEGAVDPPDWLQQLLGSSVVEAVAPVGRGSRTFTRCWTFTSMVVDMRTHLQWLHAEAVDRGIRFREETVTSLPSCADSCRSDLVVNCSGLGSRRLVGDSAVTPVRGQLLHFEVDPSVHRSLVAVSIDGYYLIPRIDDVVVGGVARQEEDLDTVDARPLQRDEELLLSRVDELSDLAGAGAPTLLRRTKRTSLGLRPARQGGMRLEIDWIGSTPVVHNYGHGGGGVTLAWGCADRVVELASTAST